MASGAEDSIACFVLERCGGLPASRLVLSLEHVNSLKCRISACGLETTCTYDALANFYCLLFSTRTCLLQSLTPNGTWNRRIADSRPPPSPRQQRELLQQLQRQRRPAAHRSRHRHCRAAGSAVRKGPVGSGIGDWRASKSASASATSRARRRRRYLHKHDSHYWQQWHWHC
jgi:hypothetical protein